MTELPGLERGRLTNASRLRRGPIARALEALNGGGAETRVVGGAVRDLALGLEPVDFDLATTLTPAETMRRAAAAGFAIAPIGLDHGTVSLIMDGQCIEATTLREDIESDGRRAKVEFGRDFLEDARRRDFTINALSLNAEGAIFDPLGGLDDLAAGRIRFIGDPDSRIREDRLRILRFFRFSAGFGRGPLDQAGLDAAVRHRSELGRLSRERVRTEVLKLLVAQRAPDVVRIMGERGILGEALGFANPGRLERLAQIESAASLRPDGVLRLAALAVFVSDDAERMVERLRLSNAEGKRLKTAAAALARLHDGTGDLSEAVLIRLLYRFGREAAQDALMLAQADSGDSYGDAGFASCRRFLSVAKVPESPIRGQDLVARGVPPGPRVGDTLRKFHELWEEAGFTSDRETVDRLLRAAEVPSPQ